MASIFGLVPVPFLDQKQTEMLIVGLVAATVYMVVAKPGSLGPVVPSGR